MPLGGARCRTWERTAWGRAVIGTLVPLIPMQPDMNPGLSVLVAVNLIALVAAHRGLEATHSSQTSPAGSGRLRCGRCGQVLSPYWRERCGVCKAPFDEYPPVSVAP